MTITWKCGHKEELWGADKRRAQSQSTYMTCKECRAKQVAQPEMSNDEIDAASAMSEIQAR